MTMATAAILHLARNGDISLTSSGITVLVVILLLLVMSVYFAAFSSGK